MGKNKGPAPPDYGAIAREQAGAQNQQLATQIQANRPTQTNPWGTSAWTKDAAGNWSQNTSLNPQLQQALDTQFGMQNQRTQGAQGLLGGIIGQMSGGIDTSGMTGWGGTPQAGNLSAITGANMPQGSVDAARQQAIDASWNQARSRLDPLQQQQQATLDNSLINSGIFKKSDPYWKAQESLGRTQTDANNQALQSAIMAGGTEAQRAQQMQLGQEQQAFGQQQTAGAQNFGQGLQQGQYQNQQRQQQLAELLGLRNQNMSQYDWLMNGQQVGMPQFGSFATAGQGQAPDLMGAAQSGYQAQMQQAANQNAGISNLLGAAASIGGSILGGPAGSFGAQLATKFLS